MNSSTIPPDKPRVLAFYIIGGADVLWGIVQFLSPRNVFVSHTGPLWLWGFIFVSLGLLVIITSRRSHVFNFYVACCTIFLWGIFTVLLAEAYNPPTITLRSPTVGVMLTGMHFLLIPYWRSGNAYRRD